MKLIEQFIENLKNTKESEWCQDIRTNSMGQHCAIGWAEVIYNRSFDISTRSELTHEIGRLAVEKGWVQLCDPEQETAFSDTGLYILATINNGPDGRSYLPHKVPDCIYHLTNPKQRTIAFLEALIEVEEPIKEEIKEEVLELV
jgi:hypothetical protein